MGSCGLILACVPHPLLGDLRTTVFSYLNVDACLLPCTRALSTHTRDLCFLLAGQNADGAFQLMSAGRHFPCRFSFHVLNLCVSIKVFKKTKQSKYTIRRRLQHLSSFRTRPFAKFPNTQHASMMIAKQQQAPG
jgi:hypothetical protein